MLELRKSIEQQDEKTRQTELHVEQLSKQCITLKEHKLKSMELIKENEFLRSKLRFIEMNGGMQCSGSIGMSRLPTTTTRLNGANLGMEDEAGEEFNNTYLSDLQNGGSQVSLDVYSATELQKRNSMYPQHMRGSYAMIDMDRPIGEQEIRVRIFFHILAMICLNYFFS